MVGSDTVTLLWPLVIGVTYRLEIHEKEYLIL